MNTEYFSKHKVMHTTFEAVNTVPLFLNIQMTINYLKKYTICTEVKLLFTVVYYL